MRVRVRVKQVDPSDPTLKVFWNDNGLNPTSLKNFLAAGGVMDGAEFHGKWPRGGEPPTGWKPPSVSDWLAEYPLQDHKSKQSWRD